MNKPDLSFEFFPPKTDAGREKLKATSHELNKLNPTFFSCTYGAGGTTRDNTRDVIMTLREDGLAIAPHLSFGNDSEETIYNMLSEYRDAGVTDVIALRGDMPSGMGMGSVVHASDLVKFIRDNFQDHFDIGVACYPEVHPQAKTLQEDINFLKIKMDAGATIGITQYFYHADAYFHFVELCEKAGIYQRIFPGIMPITNYHNLCRFSDMCGADIPRWIRRGLENCHDDKASILSFGEDVVTSLCKHLVDGGIPGFHFYTMNNVEPTRKIIENIGMLD
jgi:methylenetetrahydrofolate reductase (NADPH)